MRPLLAVAALTALAAWRVALFVIGVAGLAQGCGIACALLGAACLILLRFTLPVRIGVFLAAVSLWHWPWYAALVLAVPRIPLLLPGLISTALAKLRHPRPRWRGRGLQSA